MRRVFESWDDGDGSISVTAELAVRQRASGAIPETAQLRHRFEADTSELDGGSVCVVCL